MGIVDSNTDPTNIDFPIPGNDDSMKSIGIIVDYISNCVIEARGGSEGEKNSIEVVEENSESAVDEGIEKEIEEAVEASNEEQK